VFYKCCKNALIPISGNDIKTPWGRVNSEYENMYAFLRIYLHLSLIWHQEIQNHLYLYIKKELSLGEGV